MRREKEFFVRAAVIALRGAASMSFDDIADLSNLGVASSTARDHWNHAMEQA
jgi:hypothetical protein